MSAIAIISELRREGASIHLDGDTVRLRPRPGTKLPPDLVDRARAQKAEIAKFLTASPAAPLADDFEERAALAEFDGALPRQIAEGLARLQVMRPLPGFSPARWLAVIDGAGRFADRWAHRALALGWSEIELFGAHPAAPGARVDCRGLALMLAEADVAAMDASLAVIRHRHGGETKYRRWRENPGAMLVWEINSGGRDA